MSTKPTTKRKRERCEAPGLQAASARMMRALARRAGDGEAEAVEALIALQAQLQEQLHAAVTGYREGPAQASWADVAQLVGTSRQAAQLRYGKSA